MTVLDLTVAPPSGKKKALFMFDILLEVAVVPEVTSTPIPPTTSATVLPDTVMGPANAKLPIPTPTLVEHPTLPPPPSTVIPVMLTGPGGLTFCTSTCAYKPCPMMLVTLVARPPVGLMAITARFELLEAMPCKVSGCVMVTCSGYTPGQT